MSASVRLQGGPIKKVFAFLLCIVFMVSVVNAQLVEAKASATTTTGLALLTAYLKAGGIIMVVEEGTTAAVTSAVSSAASAYATATGAASSGTALASSVAAGATITTAGTIILTAAAAALLAGFAYWVYQNYVLVDDAPNDFFYEQYAMLKDGTKVSFGTGSWTTSGAYLDRLDSKGTPLYIGQNLSFENGFELIWGEQSGYTVLRPYWKNGQSFGYAATWRDGYTEPIYILNDPNMPNEYTPQMFCYSTTDKKWVKFYNLGPGLTQTAELPSSSTVNVYAPEGFKTIDTVPEGKYLELDLGLEEGTTLDEMAQLVPEQVVEDKLVVTPSIVDTPEGALDFNPPLTDTVIPEAPLNPGTDVPFMPDLPIPWHYVTSAMKYAASFISLAMVVFTQFLPTSVQTVVWAGVVLAILFGMLKRFLS